MIIKFAFVFFKFYQSIITFIPTPATSPLPPVEQPDPAYFTVDQLRHLHRQMESVASSGFLLVRVLVDTLHTMTARSSKGDGLPQLWRNASKQQVLGILTIIPHTYIGTSITGK